MKILMVGDCAYVGYELARALRKRGYIVEHITFAHYSKTKYLKALKTLITLPFKKCDLIHAHYLRFPAYAALFASLLTGKPFIVHCHGSDVRDKRLNWLQKLCLRKAKQVIISTPSLQPYLPDAVWLPNPVGPEFHDLGTPKKGAVYFKHKKDWGLPQFPSYTIRERDQAYADMPKVLNQYEYVLNYHFGNFTHNLSKLSLEALRCGCKVVVGPGEVIEKLPAIHEVDNVASRLEKIYLDGMES